jgi:predicted dehydrogenase
MTQPTLRNEPIRLGIIGTGLAVEQLHWPALQDMTDRFRIVAFSNRGRANAERFASYSGTPMSAFVPDYRDLLAQDDVEAVLISLPIPLNYPVTRAALEAGKHVICEKPTGANLAEGRAFVELAAQYPDQVCLIAENMFYRDTLRFARSLLDTGLLGRVHLVVWRMISRLIPIPGAFSSTPWRIHPEYDGGPHLDSGVHHAAQLRLLCGDVDRMTGELQDANPIFGGPSDLALNLRFVSGAAGSYAASYPELKVPPEPGDLRLYGTEAVMSVRDDTIQIFHPDDTVDMYRIEQRDAGYFNEFLNFYEAIAAGAPVVGTVSQSYRNMELILRGLQSAEQGQIMTMENWPDPLSATAVPLWRPQSRGVPDVLDPDSPRVTRPSGWQEWLG